MGVTAAASEKDFDPQDHLQEVRYSKGGRQVKYNVLPASVRIHWFRHHPQQERDKAIRVVTSVQLLGDAALVRAELWIATDHGDVLLQTAHRQVAKSEFAGYAEKAETQAIARALRFYGYGAMFEEDSGEDANRTEAKAPKQSKEDKEAQAQFDTLGRTLTEENVLTRQALDQIRAKYSQGNRTHYKTALSHLQFAGTAQRAVLDGKLTQVEVEEIKAPYKAPRNNGALDYAGALQNLLKRIEALDPVASEKEPGDWEEDTSSWVIATVKAFIRQGHLSQEDADIILDLNRSDPEAALAKLKDYAYEKGIEEMSTIA